MGGQDRLRAGGWMTTRHARVLVGRRRVTNDGYQSGQSPPRPAEIDPLLPVSCSSSLL
ncbi:MAG TPA: hypothetical protein VMW56_07620 [Candidatus Margulisiibacteriota bacterium]|nr:hypothetical protein [Candidatus Margulisiibacteriota bacterium]